MLLIIIGLSRQAGRSFSVKQKNVGTRMHWDIVYFIQKRKKELMEWLAGLRPESKAWCQLSVDLSV
jgi:hypothetical protein